MKTQDEIVIRIRDRKEHDFFGFETSEYLDYLDFDHAKEFLKPEATKEKWEKDIHGKARPPADMIKDYMPFAWDKANNCRGISAARSICHMIAWLWLDGKDWSELEDYEYYGKPQLVRICKEYGIDWRALDDNRWRNDENGRSISADEALKAVA